MPKKSSTKYKSSHNLIFEATVQWTLPFLVHLLVPEGALQQSKLMQGTASSKKALNLPQSNAFREGTATCITQYTKDAARRGIPTIPGRTHPHKARLFSGVAAKRITQYAQNNALTGITQYPHVDPSAQSEFLAERSSNPHSCRRNAMLCYANCFKQNGTRQTSAYTLTCDPQHAHSIYCSSP
jgi:hypothetical protein